MSGKQFSLDSRLDLFHGIETNPEAKCTSAPAATHRPLLEAYHEYDESNYFILNNLKYFILKICYIF